jgi:hypothetical protein
MTGGGSIRAHQRAEHFMDVAERAEQRGRCALAAGAWALAADLEDEACALVPASRDRTRAILAASAAECRRRAGAFRAPVPATAEESAP